MRACVVRLVSRACLHEKGRCGPAGDWPEQCSQQVKATSHSIRQNRVFNRDHEFCKVAIRPLCIPCYSFEGLPSARREFARIVTETIRSKASALLAR